MTESTVKLVAKENALPIESLLKEDRKALQIAERISNPATVASSCRQFRKRSPQAERTASSRLEKSDSSRTPSASPSVFREKISGGNKSRISCGIESRKSKNSDGTVSPIASWVSSAVTGTEKQTEKARSQRIAKRIRAVLRAWFLQRS